MVCPKLKFEQKIAKIWPLDKSSKNQTNRVTVYNKAIGKEGILRMDKYLPLKAGYPSSWRIRWIAWKSPSFNWRRETCSQSKEGGFQAIRRIHQVGTSLKRCFYWDICDCQPRLNSDSTAHEADYTPPTWYFMVSGIKLPKLAEKSLLNSKIDLLYLFQFPVFTFGRNLP